jgi:pentatricopeptide repeat protein
MRAVEAQPGDSSTAASLAGLFAIRGATREAERYLTERGFGPGSLEASLLHWARRFEATQQWPALESALRSTLAIDSTNEEANVVLLRLLAREGRSAEAMALLGSLERRGVSPAVARREAAALRAAGR